MSYLPTPILVSLDYSDMSQQVFLQNKCPWFKDGKSQNKHGVVSMSQLGTVIGNEI